MTQEGQVAETVVGQHGLSKKAYFRCDLFQYIFSLIAQQPEATHIEYILPALLPD